MKATIVLGLSALALAGCATAPLPVTQERVTRPDVGATSTREVGEPLFEVEVASRFQGARVTPGVPLAGPFGSKVTYQAAELTAMPSGKDTYYCGPAVMQPMMGFPQQMPNFCISEANLRASGPSVTFGMITRNDPANFRQELLYQGRSGTELKISYREFSGDLARPAFQQDLTFDLSDGPVVGVKGARIEVIQATNTSITYRLVQPFASGPGVSR